MLYEELGVFIMYRYTVLQRFTQPSQLSTECTTAVTHINKTSCFTKEG